MWFVECCRTFGLERLSLKIFILTSGRPFLFIWYLSDADLPTGRPGIWYRVRKFETMENRYAHSQLIPGVLGYFKVGKVVVGFADSLKGISSIERFCFFLFLI